MELIVGYHARQLFKISLSLKCRQHLPYRKCITLLIFKYVLHSLRQLFCQQFKIVPEHPMAHRFSRPIHAVHILQLLFLFLLLFYLDCQCVKINL